MTSTTDTSADIATEATPTTETARHSRARELVTRKLLATTAGLGVLATVVTLAALPTTPTAAPAIALPPAAAANAAFVQGVLASKTVSAATTAAPVGAIQVAIQNYAFSPAALSVPVGTTVTWTNKDTAPHTVTVNSGPQTFSSPQLNLGDTYSFTFTEPGSYSYYCAVHPTMTASVTVTGSTASTMPATTPAPSTSMPGMPMPTTPTSSGTSSCAISGALQTFLSHVNAAHLDESPSQQVSDILNVDTYIGNHLALVQRMFAPLTDGGLTSALSGLTSTFVTHVNTAHLQESPAQQASDILNVNSYIGNHLALVSHMLTNTDTLAC